VLTELALAGATHHPATVIAETPVRLARLDRDAFQRIASARPAEALHLAQALLAGIAARVETAPRGGAVVATKAARAGDRVPAHLDGALVVGALVDRRAVSLAAPVKDGAEVLPITTLAWEGREIYRQSAGLLLLAAAERIGLARVRLGPSITTGRLVLLDHPDPAAIVVALGEAFAALVRDDVPIEEEVRSVDDAIDLFRSRGWDDAALLLASVRDPTVLLVRCEGVHAIATGPMLPSAGKLGAVSVRPYPGGLLLDFGDPVRRGLAKRPYDTMLLERQSPRYGSAMTRSEARWLEALGVTGVGSYNRACVSGRVSELVHVSEGFHEKHIAQTADEIRDRRGVRVIAIAGPSSSGKTTFIKRLKVQLEVNGVHPVEISLDDYYVDRELSARDEKGGFDFEALASLDLALLDRQLRRLLAGERLRVARFDFPTGKSAPEGGPELSLGTDEVLLVEGIHALNPALLPSVDRDRLFRIFLHTATSLPFDRLSWLEPADLRLVRRIVRDRHQRATPAADNLARWPSVRRGERLHIHPYQGNADRVFDSSLVYEPSVLKVFAERYLLEVPREHPEHAAAQRLRRLLDPVVPIDTDHVPPTSILREFIGKSGFSY
jgi:uridine kinase